mgnify:CR=1 FL=1
MKTMKKFRVFSLLLLATLFLSACGGAFSASSWPSITYDADNNFVYVAYGQGVYALQPENGVQAWSYPLEPSNAVTFFAAPSFDQSGNLIVGDYNKGLASIDPTQNGAPNWVFNEAGDRYIGSSATSGASIYAPNADGSLYAISESGTLEWSFKTDEAIWSSPVTDGEKVYVASMNHTLYALNAANGQVVWEQDMGGTVVADLLLGENGMLYVGTFNNEILAISSTNGRLQWSANTEGWVWGGASENEGVVYIGDLEGNLYALDAGNGNQVWRINAGGAITSQPLVANDHIYVGSENGQVIAVDFDGRIQWTKTFVAQAYSSPVLAGDLVIVGFVEGESTVSALDFNGNIVWSFTPQN